MGSTLLDYRLRATRRWLDWRLALRRASSPGGSGTPAPDERAVADAHAAELAAARALVAAADERAARVIADTALELDALAASIEARAGSRNAARDERRAALEGSRALAAEQRARAETARDALGRVKSGARAVAGSVEHALTLAEEIVTLATTSRGEVAGAGDVARGAETGFARIVDSGALMREAVDAVSTASTRNYTAVAAAERSMSDVMAAARQQVDGAEAGGAEELPLDDVVSALRAAAGRVRAA